MDLHNRHHISRVYEPPFQVLNTKIQRLRIETLKHRIKFFGDRGRTRGLPSSETRA